MAASCQPPAVTAKQELADAQTEIQRLQHELDRFNGAAPQQCLKASLWIEGHDYGGVYQAGESELCGYNMGWSAVYGPSMEAHMNRLEKDAQECSKP